MRNRGIFAIILGVCIIGFTMAGCGGNDASQADGGNSGANAKNEGSVDAGGYVFETAGIKIAVDMDMSEIADQLGEPVSYFEEPSCAAQGISKLYTYASFEIDTYPDGDRDLIQSIILKDDNVATAEGVDLSMTKADVLETYGEDYEESAGSITYNKGGMKLCFILDGENLASIEYNSSVLD